MKAPSIAHKFAKEIVDCLGDDSGPEVRGLGNDGPGVGSKALSRIIRFPKPLPRTNRTEAATSQEEGIKCQFASP
jgi:hypothetical protein